MTQAEAPGLERLTEDSLAQETRRVDGNHSLGAGALAEALLPFISAALSAPSVPVQGIASPVVKALEWDEEEPGWWGANPIHGLVYEVRVTDRGATRVRSPENWGWAEFDGTATEAMARFQADFDQRILSALSSQEPSPAADAVAEAFRPCITVNEEAGVTEFTAEDVAFIAEPLFPGVYHWIDKHVAMDDGRVVGMAIWATTPSPTAPALVVDEAMVERLREKIERLEKTIAGLSKQLDEQFDGGVNGWVLEHADSPTSVPRYWAAGQIDPLRSSAWTENHMQAIRFARHADARNVHTRLMQKAGVEVRVCFHEWDDTAPQAALQNAGGEQ